MSYATLVSVVRNCYALNDFVPLKFICWSLNPQFDWTWRHMAFMKVINVKWVHKGGPHPIGLVSL